MAVTRLKRKPQRKRAKANRRALTLKVQNFQPVIKNVDVEALKKSFADNK